MNDQEFPACAYLIPFGLPQQVYFWVRLSTDTNFTRAHKLQLLRRPMRLQAVWKTYAQTSSDHVQTQALERVAQFLKGSDRHCIVFGGSRYPKLLAEISDPPLLLYAIGDLNKLKEPCVSIVGSRRPTGLGLRSARSFARGLAEVGITTASGMALGIDASAHLGSLSVQGSTIAVLACGADVVYPASHKELYERIVRNGLVVSEYLPGSQARAYRFPERNRIVSALSLGTLIVEAAERSGTLITARLSLEQNREVFVVPGSSFSSQYAGSHHLIQQGACLVTQVSDILIALQHQLKEAVRTLSVTSDNTIQTTRLKSSQPAEQLDIEYLQVLSAIKREPISPDNLIELTQIKASKINTLLALLEIEGLIAREAQGRFYFCG